MPSNILVLHPRFDDDSQRMWQAALDAGWSIVRAGYGVEWLPLEQLGEELAIYGGYMWAEHVSNLPGARITLASPRPDWVATLDYSYRMRWIDIRRYDDLCSSDFPIFVKSLHGKSIESRVYHSLDDLPTMIEPDEKFIISQPVTWIHEYRAFVLDRHVESFSRYATFGELDTKELGNVLVDVSAREYAERVAQCVSGDALPRAYVLDVGLIADRGMAVVECNPVWCSGLYGCDAAKVLPVVAASCK